MADPDALSKGFVKLLKDTEFPSGVTPEDALQQTHTVCYALMTRLLGQPPITISDYASQGGGGHVGPHIGPHRVDLIIRYLTAVGDVTMRRTLEAVEKLRQRS